MKRDPYDLRGRAFEGEALSPHEIGRAIYHFAQRRHFRGRDIEEVSDTADDAADRKATSAREQTVQPRFGSCGWWTANSRGGFHPASARPEATGAKVDGPTSGLGGTSSALPPKDPATAILGPQLLRTSHQRPEEAADLPQSRDNRTPPPVARRHRELGLTSMVGLAANPVQKKRPAGDRLAVVIGIGQAYE